MNRTCRTAVIAAMIGTSALFTTSPARADTPMGVFAVPPAWSQSGQSAVVFNGGSVDQLEKASKDVGASGAWLQTPGGTFQLLVIDSPAFLRDSFTVQFPAGFPGSTAVTLVRLPMR